MTRGLTARLAALAVLSVFFSPAASAQAIDRFFAFGDSTIDSGWYRNSTSGTAGFDARIAASVALGGNAKPGGLGLMNSEVLAGWFGLGALPANQAGGTNFATSGARDTLVNQPGDGLFLGATPTVTQINNFLAIYGGADPRALYLISSGGNDVGFALDNLPASQRNAYVATAANGLVVGISTLAARGARTIIVPNLNESFGNANTRALRSLYNDTLWGGLAAAGVNFIPADSNAVRAALGNTPQQFGITLTGNGTTAANTPSACIAPAGVASAWGLICAPTTTPNGTTATLAAADAALTRLFSDDQHFAAVGQKVYGDYYRSLVIAPVQISQFAENPVKMRAAVATIIDDQIGISQRVRGPNGFHGWIAGDIASLRFNEGIGFGNESSTPGQIVGGFDFNVAKDFLIGAAFSFGSKRASFDAAGTLKQEDYSASLYAGFARGPVSLDVIGTYGKLSYDLNRAVPVGISLQNNVASTSGTNRSLAVNGGYDFFFGPLTHGPVAGILWQRVRVDGFTETGSFTSLAFGDQVRDSAVTALGYRLSFEAGMFRPFAKIVWNHELASTDRLIVTSLTTTIAPSYTMPAIQFGKDWATGTIGTQVRLGHGMTASASFTAQTGESGVVLYGGQAGLNVAF
jgi:outer membrane lipase/esterase